MTASVCLQGTGASLTGVDVRDEDDLVTGVKAYIADAAERVDTALDRRANAIALAPVPVRSPSTLLLEM